MRTSLRTLALVLVLGSPAGCEAPSIDVTCVDTLADGAWADAESPRFVELWRAGGTNKGEELAFPISVAVAPDARIAIPDFVLGLAGVDSDGKWRPDLMRGGEGPGEVAMPLAAAWTDEGHLGVFDFERAMAVFVDDAGALVREDRLDPVPVSAVLMRGELIGIGFDSRGTGLIQMNRGDDETGDVTQILLRLPYGGAAADTVASIISPGLPSLGPGATLIVPGFPRLLFAISSDGRIAIAGASDRYELTITAPDGTIREICRSATGQPLRPDEIGVEIGDRDPDDPQVEAVRSAARPERPAPIGRLFFGRSGRLWVQRDRSSPLDPLASIYGRAGATYDVFDAEGSYLGEVQAPEQARLMGASEDRVWSLEEGPFDTVWIVAYRLEPASP